MNSAIYIARPTEGSELCQPVLQASYNTLTLALNGEPRGGNWEPIGVRLQKDDRGKPLSYSDSPWLHSDALTFRRSAINAVGEMLLRNGELLPLSCSVDPYLVVFNSTFAGRALDEEASSIQRFESGEIMRIKQYVFRPQEIVGRDLFKIPNLRSSPTFISDHFVDAWRKAGPRGLEFRRIWEHV